MKSQIFNGLSHPGAPRELLFTYYESVDVSIICVTIAGTKAMAAFSLMYPSHTRAVPTCLCFSCLLQLDIVIFCCCLCLRSESVFAHLQNTADSSTEFPYEVLLKYTFKLIVKLVIIKLIIK